jgi:hypothetical protein
MKNIVNIILIVLIFFFHCVPSPIHKEYDKAATGGKLKKKAKKEDLLNCIIMISMVESLKQRNLSSNVNIEEKTNTYMLAEYSACTQETNPYGIDPIFGQ